MSNFIVQLPERFYSTPPRARPNMSAVSEPSVGGASSDSQSSEMEISMVTELVGGDVIADPTRESSR